MRTVRKIKADKGVRAYTHALRSGERAGRGWARRDLEADDGVEGAGEELLLLLEALPGRGEVEEDGLHPRLVAEELRSPGVPVSIVQVRHGELAARQAVVQHSARVGADAAPQLKHAESWARELLAH